MPAARHVTLPPERYDQLRQVAEKFNCTLSDAVGHLLSIMGRAGVISSEMPGLTAAKAGNRRVKIDLGAGPRFLPADAAARYAKHVLGTARLLPPDAAERWAAFGLGARPLPDSGLGAVRRGAGIKLLDAEQGVTKVVAPSVAGEFAHQLLDAAK